MKTTIKNIISLLLALLITCSMAALFQVDGETADGAMLCLVFVMSLASGLFLFINRK